MTAKRYAELVSKEESLHAQISALRKTLDAVHLERVTLGDDLRVKVEDGAVYTAPGKPQTLTVRKEGRLWNVYDQTTALVAGYNTSDALARALGIWGAVK